MKRLLLFVVMLLLPACFRVKVGQEFSKLKQRTFDRTEEPISMTSSYSEITAEIADIDTALQQGLSREDAVRIALMNNPALRAEFENLGVAKSDLVQAGLYTNPSINSVFRLPTKDRGPGTAQTNIESTASIRLSDLWQVPLTKRVSEDLLEIVSLRILTTIIDLVAETKIAYDTCLAAQLKLKTFEQLLEAQKELHGEIFYRQLYGYTDELDKNNADADLAAREIELLQMQAEQQNAFIHLKQLIGITPTDESILLISTLDEMVQVPALPVLEDFALRARPEIKIAHMRIQQYKDTITLERARIFKTVDLGVSYKQDFDKPFRGWGPYINFELPIFNTNYAEISRAQFLYDQAQKELRAIQLKTKEDLAIPYSLIQKLQQEIIRYQKYVIPADQKAIDFAYTYAQTMQLTAVTAYQSQIKLYEDELLLINHLYTLRKEFSELEKTVGEKIEHFNETKLEAKP